MCGAVKTLHPQSMHVQTGEMIYLKCQAEGFPPPTYRWFFNGQPISGEGTCNLKIKCCSSKDEGQYMCQVFNSMNSVLSRPADVRVITLPDYFPPPQPQMPPAKQIIPGPQNGFSGEGYASGKVALVFGNKDYQNNKDIKKSLVQPLNDALALTSALSAIGFKVICLLNMNLDEMERAIEHYAKILKSIQGLYSLFYFSGHGFDNSGKTYLVPVDSEELPIPEKSLCVETTIAMLQPDDPSSLNVFLLDVCRDHLEGLPGSKDYHLPDRANSQTIVGYSTCSQSQSFEATDANNGIYMKHILEHIHEKLPIEQMLQRVHNGVKHEADRSDYTRGMHPMLKNMLTKTFSLHDPIVPSGFVEGEKGLTNLWFPFHRLPSTAKVQFDHGIKVEVHFACAKFSRHALVPECTNMCYVVVELKDRGYTHNCQARIAELIGDGGPTLDESFKNQVQFAARSTMCNDPFPDVSTQSGEEKWSRIVNLQKLTESPILVLLIEVQFLIDGDTEAKPLQKELRINSSEFGICELFSPLSAD